MNKRIGILARGMIAGSILLLLNGCSAVEELFVGNDLERKVYESNEKGYRLTEAGKPSDAIVFLEQAIEYIYQIEPELENLDHEVKRTELYDSPFHNLSWAYHELEEYELALEYAEKSLLILPNTEEEYTNKGNALYGLYRYEEAMEAYDQALELEGKFLIANYGKGQIYYDRGEYEQALKQFEKYLDRVPSDADSAEMKVYCLQALGREKEAEEYAEEYFQFYSDKFDGFRVKGAALEGTADFEEIEDLYRQAAEKFPGQLDVQFKLGELYEDYGEFDEAITHYERMRSKFPNTKEVLVRLIDAYGGMGEPEKAEQVLGKALDTAETQTAMGNAYMNNGLYLKAVSYFEKAIELAPNKQEGYINKLKALNWGNRTYRCVEFGEKAANMASEGNSDIPWYIGDCQMQLGNYEEAVTSFEEAVRLDPEDNEAWSSLAMAYLLLENDRKAKEASDQALELYSDDGNALYVQNELEERKKPLGERVGLFFKDNYLYRKEGDGLDQVLAKLNKSGLSTADMAKVVNEAKSAKDPFTFMIYGDDYRRLTASASEDISFEEKGNISYFRIEGFSMTTDDQFVKRLDEITDSKNKTLVLDLRGNGGGMTDSANNMLDALLPDRVTSTLIYSDGYTSSYYSDAEHTAFKHIYIFADENTASAAELLTLGLKTYLDNVTVLGRETFGKGVGQRVFEDKREQVAVYVFNHYWNVMQNNVSNTRITPDIRVKGNALESFMKHVK